MRYGVWQALGDIGGFYDGLGLMIGYLISQIAATKYLLELFTGVHVDEQTQSTQERKKQADLAEALKNPKP